MCSPACQTLPVLDRVSISITLNIERSASFAFIQYKIYIHVCILYTSVYIFMYFITIQSLASDGPPESKYSLLYYVSIPEDSTAARLLYCI